MGTEPLLTRQDPNGAARSFEEPHIDRTAPAPAGEESRLDEAMRRADDLLITSLRDEEARRRGRRRRVLLASAASGALIMGIIIIAILTGLLGNPGGPAGNRAAGTGGGDADALAKQGWALWQSGDAETAQAKFAAAVELDPHNANTWNGLGWSRLRSGKHKEAEQAFAEAVKLEPEHGAALNGLGNATFQQKKYDEAEKHWLKAADTAPASWFGLARLYALQGKFDDSAKYAEKALAESPDSDEMKRVLEAAKAKKVDAGLRRLIEPASPAAPVSDEAKRGWQLFNRGQNKQAADAFRAALKANPNDTNAENGLGFALLNSGKHAEAKPHFEAVLKLDPKAYGAMNGLARCLKAEGKTDEAIELWERLVKAASGANAGTAGLAQTYFEQKQFGKAIPYLEQLVKANPNDEEARKKLEVARGAGQK